MENLENTLTDDSEDTRLQYIDRTPSPEDTGLQYIDRTPSPDATIESQYDTISPVETTEPPIVINTSDEDAQKYDPQYNPMYEYQVSVPTTLSSTSVSKWTPDLKKHVKTKRKASSKNESKVIQTLKKKQTSTNRTIRKLTKRVLTLETMLKKISKKVDGK